ncbi:MAG: hypothetical protein KGS61_13835, partial [Verrucomicrobia bacterium]|nr:hypothetical protein [Verrucomicrobiota bacterium]
MRTTVYTIITLSIVASCSAFAGPKAEAVPSQIVVGLSPFMPAAARPQVLTALAGFVLTGCPNGARFTVLDGWELKIVCDLRWRTLAYDSPVARAESAGPALAALRQWLIDLDQRPAPPALRDSWAVNTPEFLRAATAEAAPARRIIIWGSPIYRSLEEPSFSMVPDRFPSDGNLSRSLRETPFGVDDNRRLANTPVFWVYPDESLWLSGRHRYL